MYKEPHGIETPFSNCDCPFSQNEHLNEDSEEERRKSIDFIEREFSSPRSQNARWRFCIQHMTSAKLSAGDDERDQMILSGITDSCRRHGALIVNGHQHLYSRTKMLQNVGGPAGNETVLVAESVNDTNQSSYIISEGVTMSITVGMGGYDASCDGIYANADWMELCVASLLDHRGAVIAEFHEETPWTGTFKYLNSLADAKVVDEFQLTSRLPGWNLTVNNQDPSKVSQLPKSPSPSSVPHQKEAPNIQLEENDAPPALTSSGDGSNIAVGLSFFFFLWPSFVCAWLHF
mmetsp:Transcript_924/g.1663  ORF Transcript_924/g.1663 Transcript_924/m.1663 type:complete len:290 (-) Transcript_924:210-1079(-)